MLTTRHGRLFGIALAAEAPAARRNWEYRSRFSRQTEAWRTAHADGHLDLCAHNRREQDVYRAEMIASGQGPDAPME